MKHIIRSLLGVVLASASLAASASIIVIDFDTDGLGNPILTDTPITNQYANLGVLFAGIEDDAPVDVNAGPNPDGNPGGSAPNFMTNCANANGGCPGNRADILRITFDSGVSGISLFLDSLGGQSVTFNLYDAGDSLLESVAISGLLPVAFTASGVTRIDAVQPNDGWAFAFDDLTFDTTATGDVPAPLTLALFGLGLAGLGWSSRKKA